MNPQLAALLYEWYPKIFAEHTSPGSQMSNGIACSDGWFDLLDTLCSLLQFDTDHNGTPQVVAKQVKEKLGTLRFHTFNRTERQAGMILFAESFSGCICEVCGKPGRSVDIDLVSTRCPEHSTIKYSLP